MLDFDFQGSGQGAGNIALGEKTADLIVSICRTLGVESWEKVEGQRAVVLRQSEHGLIVGIANIDTGKSLVFTEVFSG